MVNSLISSCIATFTDADILGFLVRQLDLIQHVLVMDNLDITTLVGATHATFVFDMFTTYIVPYAAYEHVLEQDVPPIVDGIADANLVLGVAEAISSRGQTRVSIVIVDYSVVDDVVRVCASFFIISNVHP